LSKSLPPRCLILVLTPQNRLERVIRELAAGKEYDKIKKIIQQLCNDFAYAVHQPHARNGGLIGLAAAAIALGPVSR
jgi:vacuole morphology and inheritance protein 14